jgi:hypothetical protein
MLSHIFFLIFQHPITGRESAGTKPKGTRLERAIRDFEKFVAQCQYYITFPLSILVGHELMLEVKIDT